MKLSIITINLNNRNGLQKTIDSVICQTSHDFEWIVIDGGSTDGSRELILDCQEQLTYWCSESDRGIYHAMNKGVAHATGDYCLFLNSGDYLYNKDVVEEVLPELDGEYDMVHGKAWLVDSIGKPLFSKKRRNRFGHNINSIQLILSYLPHQAIFIKKQHLVLEPYDENYKIFSDKKFFLKCYFLHNCSFHYIDTYISVFNTGGISNTNTELADTEHEKILTEMFPSRLINDIRLLDPELLYLWSQIPTSYRLRRLLLNTIWWIIRIYKVIKRLPVK